MIPEKVHAADPIVQRLRELVQQLPDLKDAARLYEVMLPLLRDADLHITPVILTPDQAQEKAARGLPLLHDIELELDCAELEALMLRFASSIEAASLNNRHHYRGIRLALEENKLDVTALLPHITGHEKSVVASVAERLQLDPELLWTLAQNALKPALGAWRRQLTPLVDGMPWHKGYCFICGAGAILGELQGNNQVKHLRCGRCGADWQFRRIECMYCGNEDHHTLSYLYAEPSQEHIRVEVCDKCKGYLKVINSFTATPPEMLPLSDLATLHLDTIAQGRGYARQECGVKRTKGGKDGNT
jgi:hypothetical protein